MSSIQKDQIIVVTNAFEIKWPEDKRVYHYDVDIKLLFPTRDPGFKLGRAKGMEILMRLQDQIDPKTFNPRGAYDGKKNLFSSRAYRFQSSMMYEIPLDKEPPSGGRKQKMVKITITYASSFNISVLKVLSRGRSDSWEAAQPALNMLNLFFQAEPRRRKEVLHNANSVFTPAKKSSGRPGMGPLELWRGYFQSVRPVIGGRLIVNIDSTTGTIMPESALEAVCLSFLGKRNLRELSQLRPHELAKLRLFLRGLKVTSHLESHKSMKPKAIRDVVMDVNRISFDQKDGTRITVGAYFLDIHKFDTRGVTLGVKLGRDGIFPIGVCQTILQLYKKAHVSPEVVREALQFSQPNPQSQLREITDVLRPGLNYENSEFLIGAGISVSTRPLELKGRLLPSPPIKFGGGGPEQRFTRQAGVWDIKGRELWKPMGAARWSVANFTNTRTDVIQGFLNGLRTAMAQRGMKMGMLDGQHVFTNNGYAVDRAMNDAMLGGHARFILVLLPESAGDIYTKVKRYGDITVGVPTQCVKWSRKLEENVNRRNSALDQYYNNLILKINVKLGGKNSLPFAPALASLAKVPTMVLGADVSHPGPGSRLPSFSALVASIDHEFLRYVASARIQDARVEQIVHLGEMFKNVLDIFKQGAGSLPGRIVMFRDGLSEGEFETVAKQEFGAMEAVVFEKYRDRRLPPPTFILIIVGKRHHFRFFPKVNGPSVDQQGNGNLRAGFVVEDALKHPVYEDFYLQSQPGLKGTSRPSHYTVLWNADAKHFPTEKLQELAYALCHCYSRSTRSVKIPAPVYYADLVCRRAKFHFDDELNYEGIDAMSDDSGGPSSLTHFESHFRAINRGLQDAMYFV